MTLLQWAFFWLRSATSATPTAVLRHVVADDLAPVIYVRNLATDPEIQDLT